MNLRDAHAFLGALLEAGVPPELPLTSMVDGAPCELYDFVLAVGIYHADPSPKLIPSYERTGTVVVAIPKIPKTQYVDFLREPENPRATPWLVERLPVECLAPPAKEWGDEHG